MTRLADVATAPAVQMFVDRARAVVSDFALTEKNAATVAWIRRKLDGIPLALELAAARVTLLNVDQIASRLDDRLLLLAARNRGLPERHRTLRATLEWSYDLLTEHERRLFDRVTVFDGGWTLEAAEVVCSRGTIARHDVGGLEKEPPGQHRRAATRSATRPMNPDPRRAHRGPPARVGERARAPDGGGRGDD